MIGQDRVSDDVQNCDGVSDDVKLLLFMGLTLLATQSFFQVFIRCCVNMYIIRKDFSNLKEERPAMREIFGENCDFTSVPGTQSDNNL